MFSSNTSSSGVTPDPQFNYVTMLLHGNGTNGAQNNTFLDSSTNNFTITRNGNTTQGTFSPYGSNWSNYFDGIGDYLTVASNAAFAYGTGDFTTEFWFFPTNTTWSVLFDSRDGSGAVNNIAVQWSYTGNTSKVLVYANQDFRITSTNTFPTNAWMHIAVVRSGTTLTLYVNGTNQGTYTYSTNVTASQLYIGEFFSTGYPTNGYISNLRMVKGTAVYTSAFTPPTTPLTAITNTSLLTCQSNRFIDNSSNNFTITRNGDVSVQRFSPFNPTASYTAATIGGSGHFDMDASGGVRTWLTAAGTYSLSGDFTVEGFFYNKNISTYTGYNGVFSNNGAFTFYCNATTITCGLVSFGSPELGLSLSVSTPLVGNWVHFAIVRQSGSCALYLNGSRVSTASVSSSISISNNFVVGNTQNFNSGYGMVGYISDFQLTNGTAKYNPSSTTISVPTAPMSVSGKTLALQFTNGGIIDNAMMNDLETVGNAQISTSVSKFGGGSLAFDGTDDRLVAPASPNIAFGTGDFTIEFWMNSNDVSGAQRGLFQTSDTAGGLKTTYTTGVIAYQGANAALASMNGGLVVNVAGTFLASNTAVLTTGAWYHIAIVRLNGTVTVYVNGAVHVTGSASGNCSGQFICVGGIYSTGFLYNGYFDDFRITKGYARYTANFTPPAAPFPDQ